MGENKELKNGASDSEVCVETGVILDQIFEHITKRKSGIESEHRVLFGVDGIDIAARMDIGSTLLHLKELLEYRQRIADRLTRLRIVQPDKVEFHALRVALTQVQNAIGDLLWTDRV